MAGPYYWVGGTGNWSDATNHWATSSGGSPNVANVPGTGDDVFFDAESSHPGHAAYVVTVDATANCRDMTFSDTAGGVPTLGGANTLNVYGSVSLVSGMSVTAVTLTMKATSGTKTIASNTVPITAAYLNINGTGGTFQLSDNLTLSNSSILFSAGTFDANGKLVTISNAGAGNNYISGSVVPSLYDLTIEGTNAKTAALKLYLGVTVTHNLTINGNSATNRVLVSSDTIGTARTITTGGAIALTNVDFRDITFGSTNSRTISSAASDGGTGTRFLTAAAHGLVAGMNVIIAGTTNYNGTHAVTNVSDTTHFDIATGYVSDQAGTWTHDFSTVALAAGGVGGGVCSGLVGLTPNVARTLYYHEAEAGANSFSTVGKWFTETNGGGTVSTTPPLMQDTAKFNADSFDAGSKTVTQDMPRIGSVDWTGATNVPTWTTSGTASCFGSITLITATTGMILTASTQAYTFEGRGLYTLTSAGNSWAKAITLNAPTGTLTQQDAFSSTAAITITNGTWAGGTYDLTATTGSNAGTVSGTGTWSFTSTGTIWSNTGTISFSGSHILKATNNSATTKTLSFGTSKTYINLWLAPSSGAGEFDITATTGTTFSDFKDDGSAAHAIKFTKATTTTVSSWNVGTASARAGNTNVITLDTVDGLGTFTLTKTGGGGIVCTRLNITRSTAGGTGALWWAGPAPPSTNGGTNSGWLFTAPPQVLLYGIGGY